MSLLTIVGGLILFVIIVAVSNTLYYKSRNAIERSIGRQTSGPFGIFLYKKISRLVQFIFRIILKGR